MTFSNERQKGNEWGRKKRKLLFEIFFVDYVIVYECWQT